MSNEIEQNAELEEVQEKKPYEFRTLSAEDVSPMCRIVSKIGITEFTKCFKSEGVLNLINKLKGENNETLTDIAGIQVILELANVILSHIQDCEKDIFTLLSNVSGLKVEAIKEFDLPTFTEMIIDFIRKPEFKGFIKVVSKLFK